MPTVDFSPVLAQEKLRLMGTDKETGLPLVQDEKGESFKFDPRAYAKTKYGDDLPADAQFQYNTPDNPVEASPESVLSRSFMETFYDDKTKVKALTQKYGEVIPNKEHGLVVKNGSVYQSYSPRFLNTLNPREIAEGFVEELPKMVGVGLAGSAVAALAGNPVGLAAIGTTALAAGLINGSVRTSLGRLMGTYNATDEEQIADIGLEGLANMAGVYFLPGVKAGAGVLVKGMQKLKGAAEPVKDAAAAIFGQLTQAGTTPTATLIEDAPAVMKTISRNLADAGKNLTKGVDLSVERAAQQARSWLKLGVEELPQAFKAGLEEAAAQAEKKGYRTNVSNIITQTKRSLEELNLGKFDDAVAQTTKKVRTVFRPLNEAEKTALGVADPSEQAMTQIKRVADLLGRYQNDGELVGQQAFRRLTNLNKELNRIKYDLPADASPEVKSIVNKAVGAFKTHLGQEFADKGVGDAWIAANKKYTQYSQAVDQARDLLASKEGIYQFLDRIGGKAGKKRSSFAMSDQLQELVGEKGESLYNEMALNYAASKFMSWAPKLGLANIGTGAAAASLHSLPLAVGGVAASSPRLVANAVNAAGAPGRVAESAAAKARPFVEKFQDVLRSMPREDRQLLLENPAYITGLYNNMTTAIQKVDHGTQALLQGAQTQINSLQSGQGDGRR